MRVIVAMVIACVGCSSTQRSVFPPYVRELKPAPNGLEMVQCGMIYSVTKTRGIGWVLSKPGSTDVDTELAMGQCWSTYVPTTVQQ